MAAHTDQQRYTGERAEYDRRDSRDPGQEDTSVFHLQLLATANVRGSPLDPAFVHAERGSVLECADGEGGCGGAEGYWEARGADGYSDR